MAYKNVCFLVFALLLTSCSLVPWAAPLFDSVNSAMEWVHESVAYASDASLYGVREYWASPEETLSRMAGDCEDRAILLASILLTQGLALDVSFSKQLAPDGLHHLCVVADGWYLEPELGGPTREPAEGFKEVTRWPYFLVMSSLG